jgi:hypothetical protein
LSLISETSCWLHLLNISWLYPVFSPPIPTLVQVSITIEIKM